MLFRNEQELFEYHGTDSWEGFKHRLYKHTECGAWCEQIPPGAVLIAVEETWTVCIARTLGGYVVRHARKRGAAKTVPGELPAYVREYLDMRPERPHRLSLTRSDLMKLGDSAEVDKVTHRGLRSWVTFRVLCKRACGEHTGGVRIGSIVEGSSAEVPPVELYYPISRDDWEEAVQEVEDTANDLWNAANASELA